MNFNQGLRIKAMVNKFNQRRRQSGFVAIKLDCEMFSDGEWSIDLQLASAGCFFSGEIEELFDFSRDNGLMFYIGSNNKSPVLYFQ